MGSTTELSIRSLLGAIDDERDIGRVGNVSFDDRISANAVATGARILVLEY